MDYHDVQDEEEITPYVAEVDLSAMIELPSLKWEGPVGWQEKAKCRGMDTTLFFERLAVDRYGHLCRQCPVRLACLEFAIRNDLPGGVYGGLSGPQRKGMTVEDIEYGS